MDTVNENFDIVGTIPQEIINTLKRTDIGYSWLIKGLAGVGKTTFALSLLHYFEDFEPIYLSTRVSPVSMYAQFPWLKKRLKVKNILDATRTFIPPVRDPDPQEMKNHLMRTLRFSSIPEFLKIIYEKVAEYKNPIIVIDSWDAIMGSGLEGKENLETLFTEFIRQTNAKLILIAESDTTNFLDYIVDGILTVKDTMVYGRTIRRLEINKVRTVERKQKSYAFTLYNNRFRYLEPFYGRKPNKISPWKTTPDQDELYSTGNAALDQLYQGGLRQGTFNLLEIESTVPISAYSSIMIGCISNFIAQSRGVIVHTMDGINSELIDKKRLFLYLRTDAISKNMRILMEQLSDRREIRPYIIQVDQENFNDVFFDTYAKLSSITKFQPIFAGISYDTLQFMVDFESAISNFYKHLKLIRNSNVIELGLINTVSQGSANTTRNSASLSSLTQDLSYAADSHLKIIERDGAILIYGVKPRTGLFYLENDFSQGYPQVKITPIV